MPLYALTGPRVEQFDGGISDVSDVSCDEGEVVGDGCGGEEGIDDWPWALGGPLPPKAGCGEVDAEDTICVADFDAFDPCGETACGIGVWISKF